MPADRSGRWIVDPCEGGFLAVHCARPRMLIEIQMDNGGEPVARVLERFDRTIEQIEASLADEALAVAKLAQARRTRRPRRQAPVTPRA